jgi:hypothetical protein
MEITAVSDWLIDRLFLQFEYLYNSYLYCEDFLVSISYQGLEKFYDFSNVLKLCERAGILAI